MAKIKKEWMLLSCLIAVGLMSFAGIHWTQEKDHLSTAKIAILSLPSNATTNKRNTIIFQSPDTDSSVLSDLSLPRVFTGNIFMDFYESDTRFVYAHYKSIESILRIYPLADVLTLIVGPTQVDYYKLGDNLSKHQFQKYRKRGYKVRLNLILMK